MIVGILNQNLSRVAYLISFTGLFDSISESGARWPFRVGLLKNLAQFSAPTSLSVGTFDYKNSYATMRDITSRESN